MRRAPSPNRWHMMSRALAAVLVVVALLAGAARLARANAALDLTRRSPGEGLSAAPRSAHLAGPTAHAGGLYAAQDVTATPEGYPAPPTMAPLPTAAYAPPEDPTPEPPEEQPIEEPTEEPVDEEPTEEEPPPEEPPPEEPPAEPEPEEPPEPTPEPPEEPTPEPTATPYPAPAEQPTSAPTATAAAPPTPGGDMGDALATPSPRAPTTPTVGAGGQDQPAEEPPAVVEPLIDPPLFLGLVGLLATFTVWLAVRLIRAR